MRKPPTSAFTLVELLTVLAIIVILTSLVVSVGGYVQKKSALSRATGEIAMLVSACESYKSDNGNFPRDTTSARTTDAISPKADFVASDAKYAASSLFLYKELSGDKTGSGSAPDGIPDDGQPRYLKDVESRILKATKNPSTKAIIAVQYMQDPFGNPYAYSTSAVNDEQTYQRQILQNPALRNTLKRPTGNALHGFNSGSYDLWSTGGSVPKSSITSQSAMELEWAKWVKNW
jgi:prepilin-type N-terminal cleavage/methylation domain-containing protein